MDRRACQRRKTNAPHDRHKLSTMAGTRKKASWLLIEGPVWERGRRVNDEEDRPLLHEGGDIPDFWEIHAVEA